MRLVIGENTFSVISCSWNDECAELEFDGDAPITIPSHIVLLADECDERQVDIDGYDGDTLANGNVVSVKKMKSESISTDEKIKQLEAQNEMLTEVLLEMSEILYA